MPFPVRIARFVLRLGGALPWRVLHALGAMAGGLAALLRTREWRVAERNIALCFPELDKAAQKKLLRETLAETGKTTVELAKVWTRPRDALARIVRVEGAELLDAAIASGQGALVAAPHLGAWELLNLHLSTLAPLTILYRVPQYAPLESLLTSARSSLGAEAVRAEASGVRLLLRRLKEGRMVGILPDQRPKGGEGEDALFFGHPVKTMTLLSRLAARAGSPVIFGYAERLPRAQGFVVRFVAADPEIADEDNVIAVAALNRTLEVCVRQCPAQYQWTYKRFSFRKPGSGPDRVYG